MYSHEAPLLVTICFTFVFLVYTSCNDKCKSVQSSSMTGRIEKYFGVYKPGNWWVYQNKNGTKKDSVYIINYSVGTDPASLGYCEEKEQRKFGLMNTYLAAGDTVHCKYTGGTRDEYFELESILLVFTYSNQKDSFYSYPIKNPQDSISINNNKFYNVLVGKGYNNDTYYFTPGKGLVGWGNFYDTFTLVKGKF